jgi:hypothetical protein
VFNSSTLPADALSNAGSFTDIRIQGADPLMSMTLSLTLANDDAKNAIANLTAENVLAFIDHVDVMGNNGSLVLERIDFDHQFLAFAEHVCKTSACSSRWFYWRNFWDSCLWCAYNLHSYFP